MLSFHRYIFRISRKQDSLTRPKLDELGLGLGQPRILNAIDRLGSPCQAALARELDIDPAAVSRSVEILKRNGFVEQVSADGRSNAVTNTEKGRIVLAKWKEHIAEIDALETKGLSSDELETLLSLLDRVYRNIMEACGE